MLDEAEGTSAAQPSRRFRRGLVRWGRRLGVAFLSILVAATLFSFTYNAATAGRAQLPPGLAFVRTGNIETRYRAWGDQHAPGAPIVLVHGFVEDSDTWSPLAPRLASGHYVQAYDMAGFGYTERRGPYTLQALSDQLGQFLDARGVQRPVLVAHSLGAGVVARFALDHPDRVGGILFLDGDGIGGARSGSGPTSLPNPWRTTLLRLLVRSDWMINRLYESQCGPTCPPLDDPGLNQWRRPLQVPGAEEALWSMAGHGMIGLSPDELSRLRDTGIPAAVVFGAEDGGFSPNSPAETAERIGAGPPTIIPNARHLTMISNPIQVGAAIESLAARVRSTK
jgi:pimeloyl-ACP methyl ester carboxylesterase